MNPTNPSSQSSSLPKPSPSLLPWQDPEWQFLNDYQTRRDLVKRFGFKMFCLIYLSHYFFRPPATYHSSLIEALADYTTKRLLIIGHRGSAKSTYGSVALPIYAALEHPELYPFIIPISDTGTQAALNIANIKTELDSNALLVNDYGKVEIRSIHDPVPEPTLESEEDWQAKNMLLANGVRIMARSRGQKVRGLRHRAARPSLVIVDDPEDVAWVKTRENRNTTDRWMRGEVMPALDESGRLVAIGNWLHEDALMARLKKLGTFKVLEFPLIDSRGLHWPALYPTNQSIIDKRREMGETAWQREMLLHIVAEEGQEVTPEDIHYYDRMPENHHGFYGHGVDLAISTEESADYTTDVEGIAVTEDGKPKIYIQPKPLCAHLDFHHTMEYFKGKPRGHMWFVEDIAYQKAAIQEMQRNMMAVTPIKPIADKRARLRVAARFIKNGTVVFPRTGCEQLIGQVLGFGSEEHDDLVDGLTTLILGMVNEGLDVRRVVMAG